MTNLNLKSVASAFGALALTVFLSWTVSDASNYVPARHNSQSSLVATIVALAR